MSKTGPECTGVQRVPEHTPARSEHYFVWAAPRRPFPCDTP